MKKQEKKIKNKIKKVIRIGLPETNSSSSHSVSINMGEDLILPGDPRFNLDIRDNILYIPPLDGVETSFGWGYGKANDPLTKLQYVCGIFCRSIETHHGIVMITKLHRYLRKVLGVKDVVFMWDVEYFKKLKDKSLDPEEIYRDVPDIDHNSTDIFPEITESEDTLTHFIFNPKSWLYLGNDNSSSPIRFYNESWIEPEEDEPEYEGHIEVGGDIGRIDFHIPYIESTEYYRDILAESGDINEILQNLHYYPEEKRFKIDSVLGFFDRNCFANKTRLYCFHTTLIEGEGGKPCIILNSADFEDAYSNYISGMAKDGKYYTSDTLMDFMKGDNLKKLELVKGKDYILLEVHIDSPKYGKLC